MLTILNNPTIYYSLFALFSILFGYLNWKDSRWGVCLIPAFLWSYIIRFQIGFLPITLLEAMILITFIIWLIKNLKTCKYKIQNTGYKIPIILILLAATVSVFASPDLRGALGIWKAYFLEPILFFIVFINTIKTKKDLEKVFYALGFLTITVAIFAIYQKITGNFIPVAMWQAKEHRRVNTFFDTPNAVGLLIGPIIVIYFGWLLEGIADLRSKINNLKPNIYYLISVIFKLTIIALGLLSIVFAVSRSSWFAVAAGIVFILFFGWSKKWTTLLVALGIALLIAIPTYRNYLAPIITFKVASGDVRLVLWQGSWHMLEANPIFGAGLAGFPYVYNRYRLPQHLELLLYPHNIIMNFWSEIGLLGLIAVIWLITNFFRQGCRTIKQNTKYKILVITLMAVMIEIIIHGMVDVPYLKNDLAVLFWLIISMLAVLIGIDPVENKEYNQ